MTAELHHLLALKPFEPEAPLPAESPFTQGTPLPNLYDCQEQTAIPIIAAFDPDENYLIEPNPFKLPEVFASEAGTRTLDFTPISWNKKAKRSLTNVTREESKVIGERFYEKNNRLFYLENDKEIPLTNFVVRIKGRVCKKGIFASADFIIIQIISAVSEIEIMVPLAKYKSLLSEVRNEHPEFRLNSDLRNASIYFSEYCSLVYEEALATLSYSTIYEYAGWEKVNGRMTYLSGRLPCCNSKRFVWEVTSSDIPDIYRRGLGFLTVGTNIKSILPLFLYAHAGYTACLFEEAGHAVKFLLMLVGEHGSLKTSVSEEIFQAFDTREFLNFQSTPRAIELRRNESRDMTMLLDDIFSAKDQDALNKFNTVLRVTGDGIGRGKANASSTEIEQFQVRGGVVVTAESTPNSQLSSRMRYLTVQVDRFSFDSEKLRYFQTDHSAALRENRPSVIQNYFSAYIYYLENNYNQVVNEIMQTHIWLKSIDTKFKRLNENYLIMAALARIVTQFGMRYGAITPEEAIETCALWLEIIHGLILDNEIESAMCEPYIAYLEALREGIACGDIILAKDREQYFQSGREYFGYKDDNREILCLNPLKCYKYAEKYLSDMRIAFPATSNEINKALYGHGLTEGYRERNRVRYLKKVTCNDKNTQMLFLRYAAVESTFQEEKIERGNLQ